MNRVCICAQCYFANYLYVFFTCHTAGIWSDAKWAVAIPCNTYPQRRERDAKCPPPPSPDNIADFKVNYKDLMVVKWSRQPHTQDEWKDWVMRMKERKGLL